MSDQFVAQKLIWLDQVRADDDVPPEVFAVAYTLVSSFIRDRRKAYAWPRQDTFALEARVSRRTLQRALYRLQDRGHLIIVEHHGPETRNHYHLAKNATSLTHLIASPVARSQKEMRHIEQANASSKTTKCANDGATIIPSKIPSKNPSIYEIDFQKVFLALPNKKFRSKALAQYGEARASGAKHDLILLGAQRYAVKMRGKEDQATWPHSWIEDQAWLNELSSVEIDPERYYRTLVERYCEGGSWLIKQPSPGMPGCPAPRELIDRIYTERGKPSPYAPQQERRAS